MLPDLADLADPALPRVLVARGGHRRFMDRRVDLRRFLARDEEEQ
ncbi:uncharacterized protein M6B38_264165 [Iris pallida]|uniref:Uncharacterized protein n=1 Tax=Iris pallida TaxID=29817 RepID=A0AAX6IBP9_IRIPA|nr:uncharacterized protein M6B38_264165 [Iris pallida]